MTRTELFLEASRLSPEERRALIEELVDTLDDSPAVKGGKPHSIMELAGLGAEIWEGINPDEYVRQLRQEWDHRP